MEGKPRELDALLRKGIIVAMHSLQHGSIEPDLPNRVVRTIRDVEIGAVSGDAGGKVEPSGAARFVQRAALAGGPFNTHGAAEMI